MLFNKKAIFLPCGKRSIRFRPALDVTKEQIDLAINVWDEVLSELSMNKIKTMFG